MNGVYGKSTGVGSGVDGVGGVGGGGHTNLSHESNVHEFVQSHWFLTQCCYSEGSTTMISATRAMYQRRGHRGLENAEPAFRVELYGDVDVLKVGSCV
jgi:hypothetical protein